MSEPDPVRIAAEIRAETGIDVLDPAVAQASLDAGQREVWWQLGGVLAAVPILLVGVLLVAMGATDGADYGVAGRVALAVLGVLVAGGAVAVWLWARRVARRHGRRRRASLEAVARFTLLMGVPSTTRRPLSLPARLRQVPLPHERYGRRSD